MKKRVLSVLLALCLCMAAMPDARAWQESPPLQENVIYGESAVPYADVNIPTEQEAYSIMTGLKTTYPEGRAWTDDIPYSGTNPYRWQGGPLGGANIAATGCVAFAFILSDAVFGQLPARMYSNAVFSEVKAGDILRLNGGAHTVIVLQTTEAGVIIAEGNYSETVHWGRTLSKAEVEAASSYITRYPEGYTPPDDPSANETLAEGAISGTSLAWKLTKAGTLTISGNGAMPDYSSAAEQPWSAYAYQTLKIAVADGVTRIGSCAFWGSKALSAEIASSVAAIGSHAFRESSILNAEIPSNVRTIEESAFRGCPGLVSVTVSEGVETIGQNAFQSCAQLKSAALPASVGSVGAGAFFQCPKLAEVVFAPGSKRVELGDNLFTSCWELVSVTLPAQADRIGEGMFTSCISLSKATVPQGAESIGGTAFASCTRLSSVVIPESVTSIGIAAFDGCGVTDIFFCGSEAQWNAISKLGNTAGILAAKTIHYNYDGSTSEPGPAPDPEPDPGPGHTHSWDSGAVTTPASCTADGVLTYTCAGCGSTRTEAIPALGHSYGPAETERPASCTEDGQQISVCERCGDTLTEAIRAMGHQLVLNEFGDYACVNETGDNGEPVMVVTAPVGEGYLAVKAEDGHRAPSSYPDEASSQQYASRMILGVLETVDSSLTCTITTIRFTPPTQTADGEYVYRVTVQSGGRAAASVLTTEPLRMVIPATGVPAPAPAPDPGPFFPGLFFPDLFFPEFSSPSPAPDPGSDSLDTPDVSPDSETPDTPEDENTDPIPGPVPASFADVPASEWYYSGVEYVRQHQLMNGVSDTLFAPHQTASRAMIWTILARMNGVSTSVASGSLWYEKGMRWAMEQGVTDGSSPMEDITREQLALMLWRNAGSVGSSTSLGGFSDAAAISGYAVDAVQWAAGCGILQGSGGLLNPKGTATRAEVAVMLMRYAAISPGA